MHVSTPIKSSLMTHAVGAKPTQPVDAPGFGRFAQAAVALGVAALMTGWALGPWSGSGSTLSSDLQAFQQRVAADTGQGSGMPAEVLARRYRGALAPELRLRISEPVRAEQQAGLTPAGTDAFVMRRLALYEEALQRVGSVTPAQAGSRVDAR